MHREQVATLIFARSLFLEKEKKERNKKEKKEIFVTHLITFSNYINIFFFTGNIATKKYSK